MIPAAVDYVRADSVEAAIAASAESALTYSTAAGIMTNLPPPRWLVSRSSVRPASSRP